LELCDDWALAWNTFIDGIQNAGIRLTSEPDDLIWIENKFGTVTVADLYKKICVSHLFDEVPWWCRIIWKLRIPPRIQYFGWLVLKNKILTWENLKKRGWSGPGICTLCKLNEENCLHIFGDCIFAISVWQKCCSLLNIKLLNWDGDLNSKLKCWIRYRKDYAALPIFCWWSIWRAQTCVFLKERCQWLIRWWVIY
jgi:hypothetical protein